MSDFKEGVIQGLQELIHRIENDEVLPFETKQEFGGASRKLTGEPEVYTLYYHQDLESRSLWEESRNCEAATQ